MALTILRNSVLEAYAGTNPKRAGLVWRDHPKVLVSGALTDIGTASVRRLEPPPEALSRIARAARVAPLAHDPFLVRAITAEQHGDRRLAEQAFRAARQRAPREAAPRFFLSQLYLSTGRIAEALGELGQLARLLPNGSAGVAPSLAAYARSSGDVARLKASFRAHPELEQAVLLELAKDPANAELIVRLAHRVRTKGAPAADWVKLLLNNLAQAGQFDRAYQLWRAASGADARNAIFDSGFRSHPAPPPFNWTYRSDSAGFAEPDGKGGLHVLYYGRDDAVLASQMLLLAPGSHRLAMNVSGNPGEMLRWTVTCLPTKRPIASLPLAAAAGARAGMNFVVEPGCPAQSLELVGIAGDLSRAVDVTISRLDLGSGPDAR